MALFYISEDPFNVGYNQRWLGFHNLLLPSTWSVDEQEQPSDGELEKEDPCVFGGAEVPWRGSWATILELPLRMGEFEASQDARSHPRGPLPIPTGAPVLAGGDSFLSVYCPVKLKARGI